MAAAAAVAAVGSSSSSSSSSSTTSLVDQSVNGIDPSPNIGLVAKYPYCRFSQIPSLFPSKCQIIPLNRSCALTCPSF
jgi:hypothetical protein